MEILTRKSLLYKSGLGFWCINPVQGCSHGCRYPCYAYMMAQSHGRVHSLGEWCSPKLVANAVELLAKELKRMKVKPDTIHLCLTTDPFMYSFPEVTELSLKLIELIKTYGIPCSLLTKGLLPSDLADRTRFPAENIHGISLISLDEPFRCRWEPGAAPYADRIEALRQLHKAGRHTLIHMEPYPTPNFIKQDLATILQQVSFADEIYFSGWNYNAAVKEFPGYREFYREQAAILQGFCSEHRISCSTN